MPFPFSFPSSSPAVGAPHPPRGLFVTGTGTGVGKTVLTACLARALALAGQAVCPIKAVQTGVAPAGRTGEAHGAEHLEGDRALYAALQRGLPAPVAVPAPCRTFALPASPHLAAAQAGEAVDAAELAQAVRLHAASTGLPVLVEGAGGVLVPLNARECMADVAMELGFPVLVVMRNELGALNHALLTLEALRLRGLEVLAVVAVPTHAPGAPIPADTALIARDNLAFLRERGYTVAEAPFIALAAPAAPAATIPDSLSEALLPLTRLCLAALHPPARENGNLLDWDKAHLWHPYTSATAPLPVREVARTRGTRLYLRDGRALIDGMSSWWCALHGYGRRKLITAVQEQAGRMAHVMFGGLTHAPAVEAARKLLDMLPPSMRGLERVFWADSGSVAVEVALKMALQCQQGRGEAGRDKVLVPLGGYHGDTMGAMSVCDPVNGMHGLFRGVLAQQLFLPRPACRFDRPLDPTTLAPLEAAFAAHGERAAAFIIEPVVQGAGGMWFYHPDYLRRAGALCREYGVLFILDEIATGFGRTGRLFAAQWAEASPDICCVGKGLTGGTLTLAATLCTAAVAEDICRGGQVFMHGPTFMGNPLACAAAGASLDMLRAGDWQAAVARLERELAAGLAPCRGAWGVRDVRVLGGIGVVETQEPVPVARLQDFFVRQGVWIRPFGRLVYLMPPYTSTPEDVGALAAAVCAAVGEGVHLPDTRGEAD